jgi:hypothetical protein
MVFFRRCYGVLEERLGEDEELLIDTSLYTREREEEEAGRRCD